MQEVTTKRKIHSVLELLFNSPGKKLTLIFIVFLAPMLLALGLYLSMPYMQYNTKNKGELLLPTVNLAEMLSTKIKPRWHLTYIIKAPCVSNYQDDLQQLAQVEKALGKNDYRVDRLIIIDETNKEVLTQIKQHTTNNIVALPLSVINAHFPSTQNCGVRYIIDPMYNLVLKYDAKNSSQDLLDDVKHLLKVSQLG